MANEITPICAGVRGDFRGDFGGQTVWEYVNPVVHNGILAQGEMSGLDHRGTIGELCSRSTATRSTIPGWQAGPGPIGPIEQPASMRGKTGFAEQPAEVARRKARPGERRGGGGDRRPPRDDNRPGRQGRDDERLDLWLLLSCSAAGYEERLQGPTELLYWDKEKAFNGYTLFGVGGTSYLIDMEGRVVHTWRRDQSAASGKREPLDATRRPERVSRVQEWTGTGRGLECGAARGLFPPSRLGADF